VTFAPGASTRAGTLGSRLWARPLVVALVPWALARVVVLAALAVARALVRDGRVGGALAHGAARSGLLGWDASWYERIAAEGYGPLPRGAYRFFPLLPLCARGLADATGLGVGTCLLVVANVAALLVGAMLVILLGRETRDGARARAGAWVLALAPPAFVLVMGYAEPLLLLGACAAFLAARRGRFWWAVPAGVVAGLSRPSGVLLAVPLAVEAWRRGGLRRPEGRLARVAAVCSAPLGAVAYLAYVGTATGDPFVPLSVQLESRHRGGLADPFSTLGRDAADLVRGQHLGTASHLFWVVLFVGLAVVAFRRLPASYGWYAAATLAVGVSAPNLSSFERYGLGCLALVAAGALALPRRRGWRALLLASSVALLFTYATLAFVGRYVP
jgi:hypothetical protein